MALHRASVSGRRGSKNDSQKDEDEAENNGYIQVLVKPLEQGNFSLIFNWLGLTGTNVSGQQIGVVYGLALAFSSVIMYYIFKCDIGAAFHRLCGIVVPMFTIICSFCWLSLYLRKTWSTTSVYLLFSSCFLGETLAQIFVNTWNNYTPEERDESAKDIIAVSHVTQPIVVFIVLLAVCTSSIFSSLQTQNSAAVISLVSFTRFLACTTLGDLPQGVRPYMSYLCGLAGIIVSKYMEAVLKPPVNSFMTQDGKIPVYKRRRSSASGTHTFAAHKSNARRTSLPALIPKMQSSSASFESAILGEAHGLIDDMLADQSLPPHVVSGLRALGNLLKPPENHAPFHKPRVSPLVSVTESTNYGSDSEESPYTGERPSTLPKKIRRSLPPSLLRRMSTSTWTTTTSATGMPTLELEPCRIRSSSFRHSRDGTPGSSPVGSRSNSPSPSSPTTVLTIPKSRSFSLANPTPMVSNHAKRQMRKSMATSSFAGTESGVSCRVDSHFKHISPLARDDNDSADEGDRLRGREQQFKRLNMTSDYESNDSPSSSDHSDNVMTSDDLLITGSPPKKSHISRGNSSLHSSSQKQRVLHDSRLKESSHLDMAEDADEEDENDADAHHRDAKKSVVVKSDAKQDVVSSDSLPWDIASVEDCQLLKIHRLNDWDFPIFDLADSCHSDILSKVAYTLFMEVGLFETFRIPVTPFLHYFHSLELGYREKPYHNRIHATDVLHGVYYLTTQPIPGFTQVTTSNMFSRNGSSSDSECETAERSHLTERANSFVAEDYGIMGGNFPALELMALYTAAAMHDYDHPGRTNAFLVATNAPQAVLYNDRSVLENHHAAQAWSLFLSDPKFNFLCGLDAAEFKRFRFLVIENILATDLKRHFEILAEFNAKANDEEAVGLDWTAETDRLLAMQMVIKLADINGPAKTFPLHHQWTERISEEFYEQGDEEMSRGMPISPYMDRRSPQLAKLQETFINHLVSPLCNAMVTAGLIPGTWVEEEESEDDEVSGNSDTDKADSAAKDTEDETDGELESLVVMKTKKKPRKINCILTKNMKENHEWWVAKIQEEEKQKVAMELAEEKKQESEPVEMEPIKEEAESQASSNSTPGTPTREAPPSPDKVPTAVTKDPTTSSQHTVPPAVTQSPHTDSNQPQVT